MKTNKDTLRLDCKTVTDVQGDAKSVFPLLCPVKEVDWLEGWEENCTMCYTESGIAEAGCVFETQTPREERVLWLCSFYDRENTGIEYIRYIGDKAILVWRMAVENKPEGGCAIRHVCTMTGLNEAGSNYVRQFADGFGEGVKTMVKRIDYYLKNGKMLKGA